MKNLKEKKVRVNTREEWKEMGTQCRIAEDLIMNMCDNAKKLGIENKVISHLSKAWNEITTFKSYADVCMSMDGYSHCGQFYNGAKIKYTINIDE